MANCCRTLNVLVTVLMLATLAISNTDAGYNGLSDLRRGISHLAHRGRGGGSSAEAMARVRTAGGVPPSPVGNYYAPARPAYYASPRRSSHANAAASASSGRYTAPPVKAPVYGYNPAPPRPHYAAPRFSFNAPAQRAHYYQPAPSASAASSATVAAGPGGAAASSSASGTSGHGLGGAATANSGAHVGAAGTHAGGNGNAHTVTDEVYNEHYVMPENENVYAAQSGTYANDGRGSVSSSLVRATESVENHEDGREDENHYYNAKSYGKTYDENNHESYNNADEDVLHTPNVYRSKKSSTKYVKDHNKAKRESGSGVLAHDKRSAEFNKNSRRFNENVDQRFNREGAGGTETEAFASSRADSDEDEEIIDSDGLGNFVGIDGRMHNRHPGYMHGPGGVAASGSATSDGQGNGVATSAVAAGRSATANAAGVAHRQGY